MEHFRKTRALIPRLVQVPTVRPATKQAYVLAKVAISDLWHSEQANDRQHCALCFDKAVQAGIVFG